MGFWSDSELIFNLLVEECFALRLLKRFPYDLWICTLIQAWDHANDFVDAHIIEVDAHITFFLELLEDLNLLLKKLIPLLQVNETQLILVPHLFDLAIDKFTQVLIDELGGVVEFDIDKLITMHLDASQIFSLILQLINFLHIICPLLSNHTMCFFKLLFQIYHFFIQELLSFLNLSNLWSLIACHHTALIVTCIFLAISWSYEALFNGITILVFQLWGCSPLFLGYNIVEQLL